MRRASFASIPSGPSVLVRAPGGPDQLALGTQRGSPRSASNLPRALDLLCTVGGSTGRGGDPIAPRPRPQSLGPTIGERPRAACNSCLASLAAHWLSPRRSCPKGSAALAWSREPFCAGAVAEVSMASSSRVPLKSLGPVSAMRASGPCVAVAWLSGLAVRPPDRGSQAREGLSAAFASDGTHLHEMARPVARTRAAALRTSMRVRESLHRPFERAKTSPKLSMSIRWCKCHWDGSEAIRRRAPR